MSSTPGALSLPTIEAGVVVALIVTVIVAILVAAIRHWLQGIKHELVPNSGKSMRDAVDRIEAGMFAHSLDIALVKQRLDDHMRISESHAANSVTQAAAVAMVAHDERAADTRAIIASQGE